MDFFHHLFKKAPDMPAKLAGVVMIAGISHRQPLKFLYRRGRDGTEAWDPVFGTDPMLREWYRRSVSAERFSEVWLG